MGALRRIGSEPVAFVLFVVAAAAVFLAVPQLLSSHHADASAASPAVTPSAAEFGDSFARTANAYAVAHGEARRVGRPHCVQASPAHYMCAYATLTANGTRECHLMQARWTPDAESTFEVTLAGRAARCDSVRSAIRSLG